MVPNVPELSMGLLMHTGVPPLDFSPQTMTGEKTILAGSTQNRRAAVMPIVGGRLAPRHTAAPEGGRKQMN